MTGTLTFKLGRKWKPIIIAFALALLATVQTPIACARASSEASEKPIIVCTTNVLGSLVEELLGDSADVIILVRPSLCPADYDMKPSDVYAVSKAKILFYHDIAGEKPWLQSLINAAGNEGLIMVKVPGTYNTPEGAKQCVNIIASNLSERLSIDLTEKASRMLNAIDKVASKIKSDAQRLEVEKVKVICMKWQKAFIEWVGFRVVADYNPPETLSSKDVEDLVKKGMEEGVALIADNLQVSAEFGGTIAKDIGAVHVVLTNFPGAIPGTGNLSQMFEYNAEQLFEGLRKWRSTKTLMEEVKSLKDQLTIFQATTSVAAIVAIVEALWLYAGRKLRLKA